MKPGAVGEGELGEGEVPDTITITPKQNISVVCSTRFVVPWSFVSV